MSVDREVQDVCCRVLLDNGNVIRIVRIERENDRLYVRDALGRRYASEQIVSIENGR